MLQKNTDKEIIYIMVLKNRPLILAVVTNNNNVFISGAKTDDLKLF